MVDSPGLAPRTLQRLPKAVRTEGELMLSAREANRRYFLTAYRTGEHGWSVSTPSPFVIRTLQSLKAQVPGGRLLDVGCGEGRHAIAAAKLGFKVTGIDFEPLALRRARRFAAGGDAKGIVFRKADVFSVPFRDASFDIALDCGCLHHQRKADWPAYRRSILPVLKPAGFYVLSVFSPRFRLFRPGGRRWQIAFGAYRRCFTRRDIVEFFGRGFEVLEIAEGRDDGSGFWNALMRRRGAAPYRGAGSRCGTRR
jgi:SAM-dependent methyltransferase